MNTFQFAKGVKDKNDFVQFLKLLLDDLVNKPEEWENIKLDHYIESMAAYLESSSEELLNNDNSISAWRLFAEIMVAASIYE